MAKSKAKCEVCFCLLVPFGLGKLTCKNHDCGMYNESPYNQERLRPLLSNG